MARGSDEISEASSLLCTIVVPFSCVVERDDIFFCLLFVFFNSRYRELGSHFAVVGFRISSCSVLGMRCRR